MEFRWAWGIGSGRFTTDWWEISVSLGECGKPWVWRSRNHSSAHPARLLVYSFVTKRVRAPFVRQSPAQVPRGLVADAGSLFGGKTMHCGSESPLPRPLCCGLWYPRMATGLPVCFHLAAIVRATAASRMATNRWTRLRFSERRTSDMYNLVFRVNGTSITCSFVWNK